jgi:NADPH-dependent 2,4-dienoyl-CoA reductase/sulfur reductase-like enzyme
VALGRPLIADPDLIEKWKAGTPEAVTACGYCLQGCLHRVKNGQPIGCNLNPEIGQPEMEKTDRPLKVLVAGGGPAGLSATVYLAKRGHRVTLADQSARLGGQFNLAWQAPGKDTMKAGLDHLAANAQTSADAVLTGQIVDADLVREIQPELLVWATGAHQRIPDIEGRDSQYSMTSLEYFEGVKPVKGPRVLVIGAGRTGLEIAEKLGAAGFEVTATKRTDPIGSMMEMITKKLTLMHIDQMKNVTLMPHTTVKGFEPGRVMVEKDGEAIESGTLRYGHFRFGHALRTRPRTAIQQAVPSVAVIGDAENVMDIYSAVHAGYSLALTH